MPLEPPIYAIPPASESSKDSPNDTLKPMSTKFVSNAPFTHEIDTTIGDVLLCERFIRSSTPNGSPSKPQASPLPCPIWYKIPVSPINDFVRFNLSNESSVLKHFLGVIPLNKP